MICRARHLTRSQGCLTMHRWWPTSSGLMRRTRFSPVSSLSRPPPGPASVGSRSLIPPFCHTPILSYPHSLIPHSAIPLFCYTLILPYHILSYPILSCFNSSIPSFCHTPFCHTLTFCHTPFCHTLFRHTPILSYPILSFPHSAIPSFCHTLILPYPHSAIPHSLIPPFFRTPLCHTSILSYPHSSFLFLIPGVFIPTQLSARQCSLGLQCWLILPLTWRFTSGQHNHTHTPSLTPTPTHTHTHTHTPSLTPTHTHTHSFTNSHSHHHTHTQVLGPPPRLPGQTCSPVLPRPVQQTLHHHPTVHTRTTTLRVFQVLISRVPVLRGGPAGGARCGGGDG